MKFEKIKAGMTLYDVHSYGMGSTTVRSMGCWEVAIDSVNTEKRTAVVRWRCGPKGASLNSVPRSPRWCAARSGPRG